MLPGVVGRGFMSSISAVCSFAASFDGPGSISSYLSVKFTTDDRSGQSDSSTNSSGTGVVWRCRGGVEMSCWSGWSAWSSGRRYGPVNMHVYMRNNLSYAID